MGIKPDAILSSPSTGRLKIVKNNKSVLYLERNPLPWEKNAWKCELENKPEVLPFTRHVRKSPSFTYCRAKDFYSPFTLWLWIFGLALLVPRQVYQPFALSTLCAGVWPGWRMLFYYPASQGTKIKNPTADQPNDKACLQEAEGSVCTHIVIKSTHGSSSCLMVSLLCSLGWWWWPTGFGWDKREIYASHGSVWEPHGGWQ